jgi:SEC-C motif-containing protein
MAKRSKTTVSPRQTVPLCPCGLGDSYQACCGQFHLGVTAAPTAERLMRSRYAAFALKDPEYLMRTWHSRTRPDRVDFDPDQRWSRLEILAASGGGMLEPTGTVEFVAHYVRRDGPGTQHEVSRFVREAGRWVYLDAQG